MKLATLRDGTRDGTLIVVRRDGTKYAAAAYVTKVRDALKSVGAGK